MWLYYEIGDLILEAWLINQIAHHLLKDALFNILSLANQLYQSKSVISDSFKSRKIYFFENPIANFLT